MILSIILERISLLYFVLSDLDDSIVDCREITAISRLFKEWNSAQDIPCPENALIKGRVLFRKYRKVQHPRFIFKEAVDFLGLHLTQANIVSLYDDLKQLADLDDILSPKEMEFFSILESQLQVELNSSIRGSKKLIACHFC